MTATERTRREAGAGLTARAGKPSENGERGTGTGSGGIRSIAGKKPVITRQ